MFSEKDIPSHFLDEESLSKQASSSGTPVSIHLINLLVPKELSLMMYFWLRIYKIYYANVFILNWTGAWNFIFSWLTKVCASYALFCFLFYVYILYSDVYMSRYHFAFCNFCFYCLLYFRWHQEQQIEAILSQQEGLVVI